jgi:Mg2+/Co2+ transporter CorB
MDSELAIWTAVPIVIFCLFLSAFFSGAETALTASSRARMHALENNGNRNAGVVNQLLEKRERLIGAILIGNNVVNIGASTFMASVLVGVFGQGGVIYATIIMSILVIVLSEVLPKTIAITSPDRSALAVARPLSVIVLLLSPIAATVTWIVRLALRPFGLNVGENQAILSAHDELRSTVDILHREGAVESSDRDMFGGLIGLSELTVSDVMIHRTKMRTVNIALPPQELVRDVLSSPYTRLPLWRDEAENIVGVIHAKDLLRAIDAAAGQEEKIDVEKIAQQPWFVPDTTPLRDQLKAFLHRKTHFALVVDEYGEVMGLITLEDILEEIVGDIRDEHDIVIQGLRKQADGSILIDGSIPIRDLNRAMGWSLPDEEATTIAGLVIHEAMRIPDSGQVFTFHSFRFNILRKVRNRITYLRVTPVVDEVKVEPSSKKTPVNAKAESTKADEDDSG